MVCTTPRSYATVELRKGDALPNGRTDASVEGLLCLLGIKAPSADQRRRFARAVARATPGRSLRCHRGLGTAGAAGAPAPRPLADLPPARHPCPGPLLLSDPASDRMPAETTRRFGDRRSMVAARWEAGLAGEPTSAVFGRATGARSRKPVR